MRTVKEISELTGISVRTLHYYDEIGLLKPTQKSDAGYRLYDDRAYFFQSFISAFVISSSSFRMPCPDIPSQAAKKEASFMA